VGIGIAVAISGAACGAGKLTRLLVRANGALVGGPKLVYAEGASMPQGVTSTTGGAAATMMAATPGSSTPGSTVTAPDISAGTNESV